MKPLGYLAWILPVAWVGSLVWLGVIHSFVIHIVLWGGIAGLSLLAIGSDRRLRRLAARRTAAETDGWPVLNAWARERGWRVARRSADWLARLPDVDHVEHIILSGEIDGMRVDVARVTWKRYYRPGVDSLEDDLSRDYVVVVLRLPVRHPQTTYRPRVPNVAEVRIDGDLFIVRLDQLEFELKPELVQPAVDLARQLLQDNDSTGAGRAD
ncbi:MAG TPA: hypothetical protein VHV74_09310 [Pseudonocardiaceae bacterium]|nr:hypothetical protein [Pseudonocardiaceae bacterium]